MVKMEFWDVIKKRYSVRKYQETPVSEELLNKILDAARIAPSADNRQPWYFIVGKNKEIIRKLGDATYDSKFISSAPIIIVGCADKNECWTRPDGKKYYPVDIAIAFQQLILAATEVGLGTCWIAELKEGEVQKILELPEHIVPVVMTPVGYSVQERKKTDRKSLKEIVKYDKW